MSEKIHKRSGKEEVVIVLGADSNGKAISKLRSEINGALDAFGIHVDDLLQEVIDEVGKEGAERLQQTSPRRQGKSKHKYARGWIYDPGKKIKNHKVAMIRNKNSPQLSHILEFGHPIVKHGTVVGNAAPIPHIEPVQKWCAEELERRTIKKLQE